MKTLPVNYVAAIFFIALTTVLRGNDIEYEHYRDLVISQQTLTPERQMLIWQRQVSPHQAALYLRQAWDFTPYSTSFARYLHELYYRLGQLTHNRNARWTGETVNVCNNLMAAIALFRTSADYPVPPRDFVSISILNTLPENDLVELNNLSAQPVWNAIAGTTAEIPFVILPRRAVHDDITLTASPLQQLNGSGILEGKLLAVNYSFNGDSWINQKSPRLFKKLFCRMRIVVLEVNLPPLQTPAVYRGTITLSTAGNRSVCLPYQLNIQPAGEK